MTKKQPMKKFRVHVRRDLAQGSSIIVDARSRTEAIDKVRREAETIAWHWEDFPGPSRIYGGACEEL
jgi:hypothetical protein